MRAPWIYKGVRLKPSRCRPARKPCANITLVRKLTKLVAAKIAKERADAEAREARTAVGG